MTLAPSPGVDERVGFEQSFDFSKFPSLQEVEFAVGWMNGGLAWIPRALSTIEPATSPRLSTVQLNFTRPPTAARRPVEALIVSAGKDLRWVTGEVARIKREFEGVVYLAVHWDPLFKAAFDAVKVRFIPRTPRNPVDLYSLVPRRPVNVETAEMDCRTYLQ